MKLTTPAFKGIKWRGRPLLLLLLASAWLIFGTQGIVEILWAVYSRVPLKWYDLVFCAGLALPYFLSLLGGIQLLRQKRSAVRFFIVLVVLYCISLLLSPEGRDMLAVLVLGIPGVTIGYGLFLEKKGVLI